MTADALRALRAARDALTELIGARGELPPVQTNRSVVLAALRNTNTAINGGQAVLRIVNTETDDTVATVTAGQLAGWLTPSHMFPQEVLDQAWELVRDNPLDFESRPGEVTMMQRLCRKVRELQSVVTRQERILGDIAALAGPESE